MTAYPTAVAALGPAFYLKFDETSGTTLADSSGNARDATLSGSGSTLATTALTTPGTAIDHNGSGRVTIANAAWQNTADFSIVGLIRPTSLSGAIYIWQQCTDGSSGGNWFLRTSGTALQGVVFRSTGNTFAVSSALSTSTTYHVAMTWDGTTTRLYVNGSPDGTDTAGSGARTTGQAILVPGGRSDGGGSVGTQDDVAYFDYALTAGEISTLYAAVNGSDGGTTRKFGPATTRQRQPLIRAAHL